MKALISVLVLLMSFSFSAQAMNPEAQPLLKKLRALNGREGRVTSNFEQSSSGECRISIEEDSEGLSVRFENTGFYFTPVAHVFADVEVEDAQTLLVSDNSNRPGGDACGDAGGAVNYKKLLSVTNKQVKIEESFRCTFEAFKKYRLISTCEL